MDGVMDLWMNRLLNGIFYSNRELYQINKCRIKLSFLKIRTIPSYMYH